MDDREEELVADHLADLVPPLLATLELLEFVARSLHPPELTHTLASLDIDCTDLEQARRQLDEKRWPDQVAFFQQCLGTSADYALAAVAGLQQAGSGPNLAMEAFRALRKSTRSIEALYPVSRMLPTVSRFYLEPRFRDDDQLLDRLRQADESRRDDVGIMHAANSRRERGGLSIYVPEYYQPDRDWSLVVALHGGSGHGADTLWSWLREARARGFILLSPTSQGTTWSLVGEDVDAATLQQIVKGACEQWQVDTSRILLTGMSDGATYSWLSGLEQDAPFTHLAPISGTFHPMLLEGRPAVRGKPVYLVHGERDWMFNVDIARTARDALTRAGAELVYRELADLSHTYPREENSLILDWFMA